MSDTLEIGDVVYEVVTIGIPYGWNREAYCRDAIVVWAVERTTPKWAILTTGGKYNITIRRDDLSVVNRGEEESPARERFILSSKKFQKSLPDADLIGDDFSKFRRIREARTLTDRRTFDILGLPLHDADTLSIQLLSWKKKMIDYEPED